MAANNYTLSLTFTPIVSVAYGATTYVPGTGTITVTPASGLSAVQIQSLSVSGTSTVLSYALSTSMALPALLTWNGAAGTTITYNVSVNNLALHASSIAASATVYGTALGILSAGSSGTVLSGVSYSTADAFTAYGDAAVPSAGVTNFAATAGDRSVVLTWTNPVGIADLAAIQVRRSTTAIASASEGDLVYSGLLTTYTDAGFPDIYTNGYLHYVAYSMDNVGKTSTSVAAASAHPTYMTWDSQLEHGRLYILGTF
jgi:hypothetical protein